MKQFSYLLLLCSSLLGLSALADTPAAMKQDLTTLTQQADQGNAKAMLELGRLYEHGTGVPLDRPRAFSLLQQAAERNLPEAQYLLGMAYLSGEVVARDEAQGRQWIRKAADQGLKYAQTNIGFCYMSGCQGKTDYVEASHWFKLAAAQSEPYAELYLGWLYFIDNVPEVGDAKQSLIWLQKASAAGIKSAQGLLGFVYCLGLGNVPQDMALGTKYYNQGAMSGDPDVQTQLAYVILNNVCGNHDEVQAAYWMQQAARNGSALAQALYGDMLKKGESVAQDTAQAKFWWDKSADQLNRSGLIRLAIYYADTLPESQSPELVYALLILAKSRPDELPFFGSGYYPVEIEKQFASKMSQQQLLDAQALAKSIATAPHPIEVINQFVAQTSK